MSHEPGDAADAERGATRDEPLRARRLLLHGLGLAVTGNAQAFGYSVAITATFGAVAARLGNPSGAQILGFAVCAVVAFSLLNLVVALRVRTDPEEAVPEPARVLLLSTATDVLAVAAAVGSALGITAWIDGAAAWFVAPLCSGLVYVLVQSVELAVGMARSQSADD